MIREGIDLIRFRYNYGKIDYTETFTPNKIKQEKKMQFIEGQLLNKKSFMAKSGKSAGREISVVSILDQYPSHSQVVDLTDFDNYVGDIEPGTKLRVPFRARPGVSDRGNTYINYVTSGQPTLV